MMANHFEMQSLNGVTTSNGTSPPIQAKPGLNDVTAEKRVRPLAIKLNNFFLWGSSGCFLPYMSLYFLNYTDATEAEFGRLMSIAAVVGTLLSIILGSIGDRYRAHRLVHLTVLIVNSASVMLLFVPILASQNPQQKTEELVVTATETTHSDGVQPPIDEVSTPNLVPEEESSRTIWYYIISLCLAAGSFATTTGINFSDSFSANIAHRCSGKESYGSIRFFGAVGWCLSSFALALVDGRTTGLPYLFVAWVMFGCFSTLNVLVVLFWPDGEPFNLSSDSNSIPITHSIGEIGVELRSLDSLSTISFGRSSWLLAKSPSPADNEPVGVSICFRRHSLESDQIAAVECLKPEMRRCSIAALGSSHVIEQFQLKSFEPANHHRQEAIRRWRNEQNMTGVHEVELDRRPIEQHFKHITRIQPIEKLDRAGKEAVALELESRQACKIDLPAQHKQEPIDEISLRLYLKIIELIARRNANMIRFMLIYAVVGFIIAMNWYFLFPYLEALDAHKFARIAPYVMMSCYSSETLFFYVWPMLPVKVRPSIGLSLVLFAFALRYLAYLTFSQLSPDVWPLEMIMAVEMLQSLTAGWFECILNESAVEFALEAEHCLPKLIELELVDDSKETAEMIKNSVKLSLASLSACFFDGVGVALGSLVGGWIIVRHDYAALWLISAALCVLVGCANLLLEWTAFKPARGKQQIYEAKSANGAVS